MAGKLVNLSVRMTKEESEAFSKFAAKYGISKSELFLRATRYSVASSAQDGGFLAPYLPQNYLINRLSSVAVERGLVASKNSQVVLDERV